MNELTQQYLQEILSYNGKTGVFTWEKPKAPRMHVGDAAGGPDARGYILIRIDGKSYKAHRLAWLYVNGRWPIGDIDHINVIRDDNRIINLREASQSENNSNQLLRKTNTSGVKGVHWHKRDKKWQAQCDVNGKRYSLGSFTDIAKAEQAVKSFREKHLGRFANHGVAL